jgi:AGZA family xanthine/uracil permease-like MFS transporter
MGLNAVVAFQLIIGLKLTGREAMGVIFLEGVVITILVLTGFREAIMQAVPVPLKKAISVGIGLFILFIGLNEAGIVVQGAGTPLALGVLTGVKITVAVVGILLTIVLHVRQVKGALLISIITTTVLALILNYAYGGNQFLIDPKVPEKGSSGAVLPTALIGMPDFSLIGAFDPFGIFVKVGIFVAVMTVFSIMLSDFFDTMGTLVGVGSQAGYLDEKGQFKDVGKPLLVDSLAAVAGGALSSSSCTTYIESQAGVQAGGRTGLTAVVVGLLFLVFLPFYPIAGIVPAQATAGALIAVGIMMIGVLVNKNEPLDLTDPETAWPIVMTFIVMPLTYSITNGIGAGFIVYTLVRLIKGKRDGVMLYIASAAFLIYFLQAALLGLFK